MRIKKTKENIEIKHDGFYYSFKNIDDNKNIEYNILKLKINIDYFFQYICKKLIDQQPECRVNIIKYLKIARKDTSISLTDLEIINQKDITIGDIIISSISYKDYNEFIKILSVLLNEDIEKVLLKERKKLDEFSHNYIEKYKSNHKRIKSSFNKIIKLRNDIAHELIFENITEKMFNTYKEDMYILVDRILLLLNLRFYSKYFKKELWTTSGYIINKVKVIKKQKSQIKKLLKEIIHIIDSLDVSDEMSDFVFTAHRNDLKKTIKKLYGIFENISEVHIDAHVYMFGTWGTGSMAGVISAAERVEINNWFIKYLVKYKENILNFKNGEFEKITRCY